MEGLENQKTDLILNTLRHTQPMKPITQKTRHRCPPTGMAEKMRCRIHYSLEPVLVSDGCVTYLMCRVFLCQMGV